MVRTAAALVLGAWVGFGAGAQDLPVQVTGRLDSGWAWSPDSGDSFGLSTGSLSVAGGTRDVKTEVRLGLSTFPAPQLSLDRAWTKFRIPGWRFTAGRGRLAWGTGFVLVPGDLLFDPGAGAPNWNGDELRSAAAWLGDVWASLGDEAFAEAALLADKAGARVSAAPGGVTLEAAGIWDRTASAARGALSIQAHAGLDWYATLRRDPDQFQAGAGALGLWDLGEGTSLSTRHEVLGVSSDWGGKVRSYHDLTLGWDGGWALTARVLYDAASVRAWTPLADLRWGPLQNLSLYTISTLASPWAVKVGCVSQW
jgi:hypothetical protein